jgi:hypothetical protein
VSLALPALGTAQRRFAATIILALLACAAQVLRFEYKLIGSESTHAAVIVVLAGAWLVALTLTFRADWRWGLSATLSAPLALLFFVWMGLIVYACAVNGACL